MAALGRGGMGEVWHARDERLQRDVAIKTLPRELASDPERVARLTREATSLAAVNHPNVAAIYGLEEHDGVRFLVLELVDGDTLAERMLRRPLRVREALEIAREIALALEAAHERGVVHRDLKPANVKIASDGRVKVLDFGLAKSLEPTRTSGATDAALQTEIGAVMGTAAYMSPEQVRAEPAGPQSDIWAFGVVLYEMLARVAPFARATTTETLARVLEAQADLALLPADTPRSARHLLRRCLEKDRKRRVKHAGDARVEVEDALHELASGPPAPVRTGISRRTVLAGGALVGVAGAGLGGVLMSQRAVQAVAPAATYRRLTFRRGLIRTARFGPDYRTVLYGALWDGDVSRIYTVRPESPESSALPLPPATPLAVSATGELALALGTHYRSIMTYGTLARVSLSGNAPRELQENVKYADWSPDGNELVLVRGVDNRDRVELLGGAVLAEPASPAGGFSFVRFSPDGRSIAAFELDWRDRLDGRVVIFDRSGTRRAVSPESFFNVFGLAWRGTEVWFTAAEELPLLRNTIYAMDVDGNLRVVARTPGNVSLHDAAPDGRLLIARTEDRGGIAVRAPGEATARDLSWLDSPVLGDISRDGRSILFTETGVGGGPEFSTYVRNTDGSAAVRLADGFGYALSPDGRSAIVKTDLQAAYVEIVPTGAGQAQRLERAGLTLGRSRWLPDGRNIVVLGTQAGRSGLYLLDVGGTATRAITPDAVPVGYNGWAVSPDGAAVAVTTEGGIEIFPLDDGASRAVPGGTARATVVAWIDSGLLISDDPAAGGNVLRVDVTTGARDVWTAIQPQDAGGIMILDLTSLVVTPDGRGYGYGWHRATSDLYIAEGLAS